MSESLLFIKSSTHLFITVFYETIILACIYKSILKFNLIRREKPHVLKPFKVFLWSVILLFNISIFLKFMLGLSSDFFLSLSIRPILEIIDPLPHFLFFLIIFTTSFILEGSIKRANNPKIEQTEKKAVIKLFFIPCFWLALYCPWIFHQILVYWIYKNLIFYQYLNFEEGNSLQGAIYKSSGIVEFFNAVYDYLVFLEALILFYFLVRVIPLFKKVYQMMNLSEKAKKLRALLVKEWAFFCACCFIICILNFVRTTWAFLEVLDNQFPLLGDWFVGLGNFCSDEDIFKKMTDSSTKYYLIEWEKVFFASSLLMCSLICTFFGPVRKVRDIEN